MGQMAEEAGGEMYGLPRCVCHLVRCWTLSLNTGTFDGTWCGAVWRWRQWTEIGQFCCANFSIWDYFGGFVIA
jgi:hypothetical protein